MPFYDFQCQSCNEIFERICTSTSTDIQVCPVCCSNQTVRLISVPHIVKSGVINNRAKIPSEFKSGVLGRIKNHYNSPSDTIKI